MKLIWKERTGAKVAKKYDDARTPYQQLLTAGVLEEPEQQRLARVYEALDPVALRQQMERLQRASWRHAQEAPTACERGESAPQEGEGSAYRHVTISEEMAAVMAAWQAESERRYRRSGKARVPHTWRTRPDPFEAVWGEIEQWLSAEPERTAKSVLEELQRKHPGQYGEGQLRTLQRRVKEWRREAIVQFHETWEGDEGEADVQAA